MKKVVETLGVSRSQVYEINRDTILEADGHRKMTPLHKMKRGRYKMPDDEKYLPLIRQITDERPTYGYPRVTAIVNRLFRAKGEPVINPKRVYRIMSMNNLLLQKHTGRPTRTHTGTIITLSSNMRWCSDVFEIACWNKERVRVAFCMDCSDHPIT